MNQPNQGGELIKMGCLLMFAGVLCATVVLSPVGIAIIIAVFRRLRKGKPA